MLRPPQAFSLVLLVIALICFSGAPTTAAALVKAEAATSCCDRDAPAGQPAGDPCSAPDCPCASCTAVDLAGSPADLSLPAATPSLFASTEHVYKAEFISPIEYPPELP